MRFLKILIAHLCLALLTQTGIAQVNYNAYKKNSYKWADPNPSPIPVNAVFAKEDAVYVDDQQLVSVGGAMGSITNIAYQRKARLKLLTEDGIKQFSTITLPESQDPLYDYHNEPFKNNKLKKGPDFFETSLIWFAARIIKPDGNIVELDFTDEFKQKEVLSIIIKQTMTYKYFKSNYWNFIIKNLQPGDELEYDYQLMVEYDDNYVNFISQRIFLNGDIPRQNYSLVFKYKTGPTHDLKFMNGANPDSVWVQDNIKYYSWIKKDLQGCLDESGSQPYNSLPYIIYSLNRESNFYRYNDEITAEFKYLPYWAYILIVRQGYEYAIRKSADNNIKDKQNLLTDAFLKSTTAGIPDSLNYYKFSKVQEVIADSFKYENDEALFREEDNRGERLGEFTDSRKIREVSRYKLYAKFLNELKLEYLNMYLMDKRYGKINMDYQSPMWNTEGLYAIYEGGSFAFVHPKKSNTGWYLEELPFYWENTSGLVVNYDDLFYKFIEKPKILKTPPSSLNDNIRMCNVKAEVNLNDKTISFDAKLSLSGQYSTITRFLYTEGVTDSTNNPYYRKRINDISGNTKVISKEITAKNTTFPFKHDIRTAYESKDVLKAAGDHSISIDIGGWFNHIIYEKLDTKNRQLDFYPDFVGQDTYRYYIKFDRPVTIGNSIEKTEMTNAMGKLTINISQPQPDGILIESYFVTSAEVIPAGKIQDVADMYAAISKLNSGKIIVNY